MTATKSNPQIFELSTKKGKEAFDEEIDQRHDSSVLPSGFDAVDLSDYLKKGVSNIRSKGRGIFRSSYADEYYLHAADGVLRPLGHFFDSIPDNLHPVHNLSGRPHAVLVPYNKQVAYMLIVNGDQFDQYGGDNNQFSGISVDTPYATVSFECLRRFYGDKATVDQIADRLVNGGLQIVDYTNDERVELNSEEKKLLSAWSRRSSEKRGPFPLVGKPGFTYINGQKEWHRSGTILLYDKENKFTILVGQDEGTYFGCELEDNPKTIEAAFKSLIPKEARGVAGVKRQGEWFAVPATPPDITECIAEGSSSSEISLSRDNPQSAHHYLNCDEIRIGTDGIVYARSGELTHSNGDHQDLVIQDWVAFYRNTAIRSFSVEGVD